MSLDVSADVDLSEAPMNQSEVDERLKSLNSLDKRIAELLGTASSAFGALEKGKHASGEDAEQAKKEFAERTKAYFSLLEDISVNLRREVRLFHYASKEKVLPISVSTKADWVGHVKEKEIWDKITELLETKNQAES